MVYLPLPSKKSTLKRRDQLWPFGSMRLIAIFLATRILCREVTPVEQSFKDSCHLSSDEDGECNTLDDIFLSILYRELSRPDYVSLDSEIERALGNRIKRGGDEKTKAIEELVNHCLKYLVWCAGRVIRDYGDRGDFALKRDLIDAGYIAARCVARSWDYEKGHFIPYAKESIEGAMRKCLADTKSIVRAPRTSKEAPEGKEEKKSRNQKLSFSSYEELCDSLSMDKDEIDTAASYESMELTEEENIIAAEELVLMIEARDGCDVTHVTMLKIEERFRFYIKKLDSLKHRKIFSKLIENGGIPTYILTDLLGSRDGKSRNKSAKYSRKNLEWFIEDFVEKDGKKTKKEILRKLTNAVNYIWRTHLKKKLENDEEIIKISKYVKRVIGS